MRTRQLETVTARPMITVIGKRLEMRNTRRPGPGHALYRVKRLFYQLPPELAAREGGSRKATYMSRRVHSTDRKSRAFLEVDTYVETTIHKIG